MRRKLKMTVAMAWLATFAILFGVFLYLVNPVYCIIYLLIIVLVLFLTAGRRRTRPMGKVYGFEALNKKIADGYVWNGLKRRVIRLTGRLNVLYNAYAVDYPEYNELFTDILLEEGLDRCEARIVELETGYPERET